MQFFLAYRILRENNALLSWHNNIQIVSLEYRQLAMSHTQLIFHHGSADIVYFCSESFISYALRIVRFNR